MFNNPRQDISMSSSENQESVKMVSGKISGHLNDK